MLFSASFKIVDEFVPVFEHRLAVRCIRHTQPTGLAPIIFLHDSLGCITLWRDFPEVLAQASGRDAIIYDRAGYGQSSGFTHPRGKDYMRLEGETILPELMRVLGVPKAALFGHSDGGTIALLAAALRPDLIEAAVVEGVHIFVEEVTLQGVREAVQTYQTTDIHQRLTKYHGDKVEALHHAWTDTWLAPWYQDWTVESLLSNIQCPTLVIQGEQDEFGSMAQVDRSVAAIGEHAQALKLPECGHSPHKQARERIMPEVLKVLS